MAKMEFEDSAETEAGVEATVSQMIRTLTEIWKFVQGFLSLLLKLLQAILQSLLAALVVKSVLIQLAPQKGNNGVASAKQRHHCCQKGLVSLMVLVPELQTALMTTPLVPAAMQNMFRLVTKRRNARRLSLVLV